MTSHLASTYSNLVLIPILICSYRVVISISTTLNRASVALLLSTKICKKSIDIVIIPILGAILDGRLGSEDTPTGSEVKFEASEVVASVPFPWYLNMEPIFTSLSPYQHLHPYILHVNNQAMWKLLGPQS